MRFVLILGDSNDNANVINYASCEKITRSVMEARNTRTDIYIQ